MQKAAKATLASVVILGVAVGGIVYGTGTVFGDDDEETPITGEALIKASAAALAHTGGGTVTETEVGEEESYYEVEVTLDDGSQVDVQLDEHFNVVSSEPDDEEQDDADDDETEVPITGEALKKASAAALAYTKGGKVTETEVGDEESYYEVEVTLDDGSQVDVQLDEEFNVVSSASDDEEDDD